MLIEALLILILVSLWAGLYQIVKQQGRIILRLDALEQGTAPAQDQGLKVGTTFPSFSFEDFAGRGSSLEDFHRKRVLLVHWNPECGFCDLIASDLARIHAELEERNCQLLLLAYGNRDANRKLAEEHSLRCPILLYGDRKPPAPFQNLGTPSACLLDSDGHVLKPVAIGSEEVPALAEQALRLSFTDEEVAPESGAKRLPGEKPLSASRIVRNGLKAGTPAPRFSLPEVSGGTVSLDDFRGRRMLLVFSDPHCGPCDELAPTLARFDQEHGKDLALVMVGRGNAEENRGKAEQYGIQFPVVIQDKWRLSKEYGIFSTPVAFLIDEQGVIAKDVAIGPNAILDLAQEGLKRETESTYELSYR
jgi:peroxiredoxin